MKILDLQQTADYLENANIMQTVNADHAVIHMGKNEAGVSFVLVNDMFGQTALTESL